MKKWLHILPTSTGLRPYVWIIFCILPFYFLFKSSSKLLIVIGIAMILLFFVAFRLGLCFKRMACVFLDFCSDLNFNGYDKFIGNIYFSLFLAHLWKCIKNKGVFIHRISFLLLVLCLL